MNLQVNKNKKRREFLIILFSLTAVSGSQNGLGPLFTLMSSPGHKSFSEPRTNLVLLQDSGGLHSRLKRDITVPVNKSVDETDTKSSDTKEVTEIDRKHQIYSAESAKGSPKGHVLEDLDVSRVDITEKEIHKGIESSHPEYEYNNTTDNVKYYKHTFHTEGDKFFLDLDIKNKTGIHEGLVTEHDMLSQSYRRAATIHLKFKFPFYGHEVENITIATGGFLYTGDYVHSWLAATQYIAPLMANFDTSNNNEAKIRYFDDGTKLVVEWKDVYLQERENEGSFTFQVVLHNNGDIWFAYQTIPMDIALIKDEEHPVKVGLSDAYIIDRTIYFARRKTIYEYHRLNMKGHQIQNSTAIEFRALKTCNTHKDCQSCVAARKGSESLDCRWCPKLSSCSDGTDRNRQDWLKKHCDIQNISRQERCPIGGQSFSILPNYSGPGSLLKEEHLAQLGDQPDMLYQGSSPGAGTVILSMLLPLLVISTLVWVAYAYFNPNTCSGRFLIKYRPAAWKWRQSGGRYTAASIHM